MKVNIDHLIDEALKTEPYFNLRKDFKDRVVKAIRRQERISQRKLYSWMVLGTVVIVGLGYATISYFLPNTFEVLGKANQGISGLTPLAILIGVLVIFIQYLDKRLVKNKLLTNQF